MNKEPEVDSLQSKLGTIIGLVCMRKITNEQALKTMATFKEDFAKATKEISEAEEIINQMKGKDND